MKAAIRRAVDRHLPALATTYRRRRDDRKDYGAAVSTPWGFALVGDSGLADSRAASHEADTFLGLLSDADHVVDVGANVGLFTLLAASKGVPVTAIEPNAANVAVLLGNLRDNGLHAEVLPVALSDHTDVLELYGGGQGASLLPGWGGMTSTYSTLVPVATLDDLFADRLTGKRALIKVDAEGAEYPILRGARRLIAAEPAPAWIVEIGLTENFDSQTNPDFAAIFELFWDAGYSAHAVEADRPVDRADVAAWVAAGDRGFWNINYRFTRG